MRRLLPHSIRASSLRVLGAVLLYCWPLRPTAAQGGELFRDPAGSLAAVSHGKLKLSGEVRSRHERRSGQDFGGGPDLDVSLWRIRVGLSYQPNAWLKLAGTLQDSRAPGYGAPASVSWRNAADLYEGYVELSQPSPRGLSFSIGRRALNYGDGKLIATPNWGNVSRTFDHARLRYRTEFADYDFLFASPVKPRTAGWDRPVLGDRLWGFYTTFHGSEAADQVEIYALRREQNRPGGFTATSGRLQINTAGGRWAGSLPDGWKGALEVALQSGKVGSARHRALGWSATLARRWVVGCSPLDGSLEYKYASGSRNPGDSLRSSTFDQLYFAGHDRFGHMDLFGWRNIHNVRVLWTLGVTNKLTVNLLYNSWWLASSRDALYSGSGKALLSSPDGCAGSHVGQEWDLFGVYQRKPFSFGLGAGRVLRGSFLRNLAPSLSPLYLYVSHTYTF
ncbi:MAG: alginate export family protein [Bryobacteraceae bacterium]